MVRLKHDMVTLEIVSTPATSVVGPLFSDDLFSELIL